MVLHVRSLLLLSYARHPAILWLLRLHGLAVLADCVQVHVRHLVVRRQWKVLKVAHHLILRKYLLRLVIVDNINLIPDNQCRVLLLSAAARPTAALLAIILLINHLGVLVLLLEVMHWLVFIFPVLHLVRVWRIIYL